MTIDIVPSLSKGDIETIIGNLPDATYAEVYLFGDFNFSSIYQQVRELHPNAELEVFGGEKMRLKNPSKETLLEIYRRSRELANIMPTKEDEFKISPRIDLGVIRWNLDDAEIVLDSTEIHIHYKESRLPQYLSEIIKRISEGKYFTISIRPQDSI